MRENITLDFSELFAPSTDTSKTPKIAPITSENGKSIESRENTENPVQAKTEHIQGIPAGRLLREVQEQKTEQERARRILREYQDNTRASEQLQTELLKGAQAGKPLETLFLKAVQAIALMTHDEQFYTQIERAIKAHSARNDTKEPVENKPPSDAGILGLYAELYDFHAANTPAPTTADGWKRAGAMGESICTRYNNNPYVIKMAAAVLQQIGIEHGETL